MEKYPNVNWPEAIKPLLKKYKNEKHPLDYKNAYQLIVMVVLSSLDSDKHINKIAPVLFEAFPDMTALSKTTESSDRSSSPTSRIRWSTTCPWNRPWAPRKVNSSHSPGGSPSSRRTSSSVTRCSPCRGRCSARSSRRADIREWVSSR